MKVSCVGRGLMGYLGNKGSISISMSLHQTSFCFIRSHLTSGQKEGDEERLPGISETAAIFAGVDVTKRVLENWRDTIS
ncbi:hypothetical protein L2E82_16261 [Cichorium intybus]|uniref:Uncharacterized protein n=1 Tax=Cichorium intybus TaxID=13427 RepID=A0ACB9F4K3_CICIN|nr:hypothetical protein L2E82_16261 [Cichorium intybus]